MVSAVPIQSQAGSQTSKTTRPPETTFWRVEGSLLNLSAVRPVAFFTWNAQSFSERWFRRSGLALTALVRPLLYAADRVFATRFLHMLLRGVSRDRLDFTVIGPAVNEAFRLEALTKQLSRTILVSEPFAALINSPTERKGTSETTESLLSP